MRAHAFLIWRDRPFTTTYFRIFQADCVDSRNRIFGEDLLVPINETSEKTCIQVDVISAEEGNQVPTLAASDPKTLSPGKTYTSKPFKLQVVHARFKQLLLLDEHTGSSLRSLQRRTVIVASGTKFR
jgi:hypothetical protein